MDSAARNVAERVYDDFEPSTDWAREAAADTLLVYLPGFRKEQLKVQVTSARGLRLTGERQVNGNRWSRFRKEIAITSNYDPNEITAKFEKGILYVKMPKIIVPDRPQQGKEQAPPPVEAKRPTQEEKAQPPVQVPKPEQKLTPQGKAPTPAEAAKSKIPPPMEGVKATGLASKPEKPSQEKDKPLVGENAKPEKPRIEPAEGQGPTDPRIANGNSAAEKAPVKDKEESKYGGKEQKPESAGTSGKHEKLVDSGPDTAKLGKDKTDGSGETTRRNYRQVLGGLAVELKNPKKLINLVLAILSVVVFVLYAMKAIGSLRKPETEVF
ncbi:hypothetical protein Tsubulata_035724 [Turnera subulata]|uniref:SHSP domain-containing protein n=1 Tax=Turnera subulata TaxID=218843 RepID=A0A9Q0FLS9_9ROSI|nr:hypothetical protein Tsubulata_035724 [Turnera subulata]